MTRNEMPEMVQTHAQAVAKALGPEWGYAWSMNDQPRWYSEITGSHGECLSVSIQKDRFHWGVRYPKGPDGQEMSLSYGQSRPSITVALNRPIAQVAAAIKSRLLPDYLPQLEAAQLRVAEAIRYAETMRANVSYLAQVMGMPDPGQVILGGSFNERRRDRANVLDIPFKENRTYGDVQVHGDRTATMTLRNVPVDLAAQLLRVIRDRVEPVESGT